MVILTQFERAELVKKAFGGTKKRSKYNNVKTTIDGHTFDSRREAARYQELKLMEKAGAIGGLTLQHKISIDYNGVHICNYFADFYYYDTAKQEEVYEDVKGRKTDVYRLKKKMVWAFHKIKILET